MTIYSPDDAEPFEAHGSRFVSFVSTARGGGSLCAWRLEVPAELVGVSHRPSHDEVILVLAGELRVTLDGTATVVRAGGVVHVPAGSELRIDGGSEGASAWVTTTAGLTAQVGEAVMAPPWAQ